MRRSFALTVVVAASAWTATAYGVQRETCMGAAESAQELKRQGRLRSAREQLNVCAQKGCPTFVRRDCSTWLGELDAEMPTVVLRASDESGRALTDVRVLLDGTVVTSELGKAPSEKTIEVDPGAHVFRFEGPGGSVAEERVTLAPREKLRPIAVKLRSAAPAARATADAVGRAPEPQSPDPSSPIPVGVYVFGAATVVALGSFVFFAASGASEYGSLERTCKPNCNSEQTSGVETKFLVANVSVAVAAVSLAAGGIIYFTRPRGGAKSSGLVLSPAPGGAAVRYSATF